MSERKTTSRSHEFIQAFQFDGVCDVLRLLVSTGVEPGSNARAVLKTMRDDFMSRMSGHALEMIPEIDEETTPADLLFIAELIRASNLAFLSPEELEERAPFGLHPRNTSM